MRTISDGSFAFAQDDGFFKRGGWIIAQRYFRLPFLQGREIEKLTLRFKIGWRYWRTLPGRGRSFDCGSGNVKG
jgi:hypothetical protein